MRKLLWVLVVLAVLAVGADRLAVVVAERAVADRVQDSQDLSTEPDVDITGFPFLTQLARRHYDEVRVTAGQVEVGERDRRVRLSTVVVLRDVRTDRSLSRFTAARGRATATITYAELGRVLDLRLRYAGDGRVRATKRFTVAGQTLDPSLTVTPRLLDGALGFTDSALTGDLPGPVAAALRSALDLDVPLSGLPFDVRARSVAARPGGLRVVLTGTDLSYP